MRVELLRSTRTHRKRPVRGQIAIFLIFINCCYQASQSSGSEVYENQNVPAQQAQRTLENTYDNHRYDTNVVDEPPEGAPAARGGLQVDDNQNDAGAQLAGEQTIGKMLTSGDDSSSRSIYSSLLKILYSMKQQLDKSNSLRERADNVKLLPISKPKQSAPPAASRRTTTQPETTLRSSVEPQTQTNQQRQKVATTSSPLTTILEVTSEPLEASPSPSPSPSPALITESASWLEATSPLVVTERNDDLSLQRNSLLADQQQVDSLRLERQPFSPKYNLEKVSTPATLTAGSWNKPLVFAASNQRHNKVPLKEDSSANPDKSLFSLTSFSDSYSPSEGEGADGIGGFNSIFDNLADTNNNPTRVKYSTVNELVSSPEYSTGGQPSEEFYESRPLASASNRPLKSKKSQKARAQTYYQPSPSGNKLRLIRPGEYYNPVREQHQGENSPDAYAAADLLDGRKYSAQASGFSESYANSNQQQVAQPKLYNGVHLQQIYGSPSIHSNAQTRYIQQQAQQYHQQQQQQQQNRQPPPTSQASGSSTYEQNSEQHQQRDLLNQPQTIQITAVPNAFPLVNGLRTVNGYGINNGFAGNGLFGFNNGLNGFLDPLGRQVVMVNAERRQIDWSFWIWPILLVIALPLVLGALFVPVFLKTIIILIQVLQSLGLLLPITNALTQQIASTVSKTSLVGVNQVAGEQTKT